MPLDTGHESSKIVRSAVSCSRFWHGVLQLPDDAEVPAVQPHDAGRAETPRRSAVKRPERGYAVFLRRAPSTAVGAENLIRPVRASILHSLRSACAGPDRLNRPSQASLLEPKAVFDVEAVMGPTTP